MISLTNEGFEEEVLGSKVPVVLFGTDGSKACAAQEEEVLKAEKLLGDEVKVCCLDVNQLPMYALKFGLMDLPSVILMNMGLFCGKSNAFVTGEEIVSRVSALKNDLTKEYTML